MTEEATKDPRGADFMTYEMSLANESWWVILIAGIVTIAFGAIILAWPLMTLAFLVTFFGSLAIIFGAFGVIRSLFLIKRDKNWWIILIEGVLGIIIGIMVFVWPMSTTIFLVYFIAAWLLITGITAIAHGSTTKNSLMIVNGVIALILGIFIFFKPPFYATATLILFIGFFAVFRGIALIVTSIVAAVARNRGKKAAAQAAK